MHNFTSQHSFICKRACVLLSVALLLSFSNQSHAQDPWKNLEKRPSTLNLEKGLLTFNTPKFRLKLAKASQTVAALEPISEKDFDYTPSGRLKQRSSNGMYHLGDINLRLKAEGETVWTRYSTAANRADVLSIQNKDPKIFAAADLSPTLPKNIPLNVKRFWENENGNIALKFVLTNTAKRNVEIGALGMPMIFNNILQGEELEQAHAKNVFYDPYIGNDAGYLQVTRLSGNGPVLLVTPLGKSPFEAYNPLLDDPTPKGIDFEGFHEWMVFSKAYAENEWKAAEQWNNPTSVILKPGQSREYGVQFTLSPSIKAIEQTLAANKRPVAVGIPGYVLPQNTEAKLFLNYVKKVKSMQVEPAGALIVTPTTAANAAYQAYLISSKQWGRARLTVTYADGLSQTINYKVIKPEAELVKDYGHFLTTKQWFDKKDDPFGRAPSAITYDYDKKQQVAQDSRVWIAGLSDEGGAGSWLGAMMKQLVQPDKTEIDKLQEFVNKTLFGNIQHANGPQKYGVKKSVFYYQPDSLPKGTYSDSLNWKTWAAWSHKDANDVGRSYNYPHVTAAHWVMYRLARNHTNLVTQQNWQWYLNNSYETAMSMVKQAPYYAQFGQMEGTVFYLLLMDLKAENWNDKAALLEKEMRARADHWHTLKYPFGSEMPWDSTGQEEVYLWSQYFGFDDKAQVTINAILGYMPTVPHWGYNGSARRYWDFLYGGKLSRIERQLHHYGSGLNAIPVLSDYRKHPDDLYLLRVGYGGQMGSVSNITQDGFGPAAFHSYPSTLKIDGLSGDYGPNFFGYAVNSATYIANDKNLGWLAFGGNLKREGGMIVTEITTASAQRVFIAPLKLWLTLDAGTFKTVSFNPATGKVLLTLNAADAYTPKAYLRIQQDAKGKRYKLNNATERGAYVIPLKETVTTVSLL
ncbi:hypothetical protein DYU05_10095 [Mucilaginibacter terrenus]|uniref:Glycoside hydrolase n=2 Tax=Mucilaginibacter terrenus TaxID=2482727 RepID=A0A3E2NYN2_9SPHI|nr:hypothetical protein DYU05_10095 [Mucilaginibacter terrenus]